MADYEPKSPHWQKTSRARFLAVARRPCARRRSRATSDTSSARSHAQALRHAPHTIPPGVCDTGSLLDGQRIVREVDHAPGFAERLMSRAEVERKFRCNVGNSWPKERADAILQALWALDQTEDLSLLLGNLGLEK